MASEKEGYTLTDRATYLALRESLELEIVLEGDPALFNPYSLVLINSSRYPNIRYESAIAFLLFITSPEGQGIIGNYTLSGERIFFPIYGNTESLGLPPEDEAVAFIEALRARR